MLLRVDSLADAGYEPWGGAVDLYREIEDAGKLGELDELLDDLFGEGRGAAAYGLTTVNDLLWFDGDFVRESLGLPVLD